MSVCGVHQDVPTVDGVYLCGRCFTRLEQDLAEVSSVWEDLQTTVARLDRGQPSLGSGSSEPRLPVNLDAMDKGETLRVVLNGWAALLPSLSPVGDVERVSSYLFSHLGDIAKQEWAGDLASELHHALNDCRRATDRAAERFTLGPCGYLDGQGDECTGTLVMRKGEHYARCQVCGATINANERQRWMIANAWHVALPLPQVLNALEAVGVSVKIKTARSWVTAGKLEAAICSVDSKQQLFTPAAVHQCITLASKRVRVTLSSLARPA